MRPVIGITAYVEPARWGVWELVATLVPHRYVEHVLAAGARPVLLPPYAASDDEGRDLLSRVDGLLLTGGSDLDPSWYGAEPDPATTGVRPERDASEHALVRAALVADLPVLGVCRGMQLLTVACGGTLHQHLPDVVGHEGHRGPPGVYAEHSVRLAPGSRVGGVLGEQVVVRSYHHQGIATTGEATPTGWAAPDGSIEVIEVADRRFAVGVLWHPEAGDDPRLFSAFVSACGEG